MRTACAALAVAAMVLAGCASDTDDRPATSKTSASSSNSDVTTTPPPPPPTAIDYGPVTLVTGSDTFSYDEGRVKKDPDGTSHSRHGWYRSTLKSNDERVTGTHVATWNSDRWGTLYDGALIQWGTARITTRGGGWVGRYTGIYTSKTHDVLTWWFTGTGGYEGLSMYLWEETSGGFEATFHALIFPGDPPPS